MPVDLATLDDKDKPVRRRIRDPKSAHKILEEFLRADVDRAYNRGIISHWLRGEPPKDRQDLIDSGMGWQSNVNTLKAAADKDQSVSNFNNLSDSVPSLCAFRTRYGKPEDRTVYEKKIAKHYDWLLKTRYGSFYDNRLKTADAYIDDALGVCYWPDDVDWRFEVSRRGPLLFAADADIDESKQDIIIFVEDYSFSQLIKLLNSDQKVRKNEDKSNIDRDAVIQAIKDAAKGDVEMNRLDGEALVREIEENCAFYDYAKNQKIKLAHYFVKESSGKVTHSVGRADGKNKEYLSDRYEAYPCMQDVFVFYADSAGCWKISDLRGMTEKALPMYIENDSIFNSAIDHLKLSLTMLLQSDGTAGAQALLSQISFGSMTVMPKGMKMESAPVTTNAGSQVFPILSQFERIIGNNTGGYQQHAVSPEGGNRTATEVSTQAASTAALSSAKLGGFYQSDAKLHWNIVRRLQNDKYVSADDGYEERMEFFDRLVQDGVPLKAFFEVYEVTPTRAIGYGSYQQQQAAFSILQQQAGTMDQVGQLNLAKDIAAAAPGVGYDKIERYWTEDVARTPDGTRDALNEHDTFRNGSARPVFPDDPHIVHAVTHNGFFSETLGMLQQGQIQPADALKQMGPALQHQNEHLQLAAKDPTKKNILAELHKQFGQYVATFQKLQEQAQKEQQAAQGQPIDPKIATDELNALATAFKDGIPITHEQLNAVFTKMGLPPFAPDANGNPPMQVQAPLDASEQESLIKTRAEIARGNVLAAAEIQRENAKTASHIQSTAAKTGAHIQTNALKQAASAFPQPTGEMPPPEQPNYP